MKTRFLLPACLLIAGTPTLSFSQDSQPQPALNWVTDANRARIYNAISPPPTPNSGGGKIDFQSVLKAESTRTLEQSKEALADQKFTLDLLMPVIDPNFNPQNYPVTFGFLHKVGQDVNYFNTLFQTEFKRNAPDRDHPEIKPLFPSEALSYPCGDAATSRTMVLVLSRLVPDKADALLKRDIAFGQSRVNAGVNYPSDIYAARHLAVMLMYAFQVDPDFLAELAKAKAEIDGKQKSGSAAAAK